ncbi:hypothetical protein Lsha_0716, partial [Legionella shakespearei DSM 23087]
PDPLTQDLMYLKLYPHGVIGTATSPELNYEGIPQDFTPKERSDRSRETGIAPNDGYP